MQRSYYVQNSRDRQDEVKVAVIADSLRAEQDSHQKLQDLLLALAVAASLFSAYLMLG